MLEFFCFSSQVFYCLILFTQNADRELETKLASFRKRLQVTLKDVGNTPDYNGKPPSSVSTEQMRESGNERLFEERYASQTASLVKITNYR